jgi:DNA-binding PadR family transcriptional regulator
LKEIDMGILAALSGLILLYFGMKWGFRACQRKLIPDRYAWLELLDREEWKTPRQLISKMYQRVGTTGSTLIELDLEELEEEKLIESQEHESDEHNPQDDSDLEYQLTTAGWKKLLQLRRPEQSRTLPRTV